MTNALSRLTSGLSTLPQDSQASSNGGLSAEAIVGISVGCCVYIVVMIVIIHIICICTRRKTMVSASRLPSFPDSNFYGQSGRGAQRKRQKRGRKTDGGQYRRQLDEYTLERADNATPATQREYRHSPVVGVDNIRTLHPDDPTSGYLSRPPLKGDVRLPRYGAMPPSNLYGSNDSDSFRY
jgi:hypothetical protein